VQRNPILAEVFFRGGFIERWGRGTNRVIDECVAHGIAAPTFEEITGGAVVTFRVPLGSTVRGAGKVESEVESKVESQLESVLDLSSRVLVALLRGPLSKAQVAAVVGKQRVDGQLHATMRGLLESRLVQLSIPDKPNSRLQKYRLTAKGRLRAGRARRGPRA
jgi:ATP-dependent DNA helicase RecG